MIIKRVSFYPIVLLLLSMMIACTPETRLLNRIPINTVSVEVTDQAGQPIPGAQVEASNGRKTTTDEKGIAKLRFGSVGVHHIGIMADNYMPANYVVTMPTDNGRRVKTSLTAPMQFSAFSFTTANLYPLMFNYLFNSYGYGLELKDYQEGEWTSWGVSSGDEKDTLRLSKGFLKRMDNGQEWWQIKVHDQDGKEAYVAEVLFAADRSTVRRFREKIGDNEIQEKPVSEEWYNQPATLTKESKNASLVSENINLQTPKGTFKANQFKFGLTSNTFFQLWESQDESVPGGVLKYQIAAEEEPVYESILMDYGKDAVTMLESY